MAQVTLYQFAAITHGTGKPIELGSRSVPSTIALTGTGEVHHKVFNDLAATTLHVLYNGELTGIKFYAVKSSVDSMLAINEGDATESIIHIESGVWQFFSGGSTGAGGAIPWAESDVTDVSLYVLGAVAADVEFIAVY